MKNIQQLTVACCISFIKREIQLVADSLRLGGAILGQYPDMLAPQLVGRLLSEMDGNDNIRLGNSRCKVFQKIDPLEWKRCEKLA